MIKRICCKGFSLLEVMLALVVITVAGLGAYSLFDSGVKSSNITEAEGQAVQIANVYTDLASSNLTAGVTAATLPALLQNSGRLSSKYFSGTTTVQMNNAFGQVNFTGEATPYSFIVEVPLGSINDTSSLPEQFFSKVKDVYSCDGAGAKVGCTVGACTAAASSRCIVLFFNMNN